jgi:hypothetical protein
VDSIFVIRNDVPLCEIILPHVMVFNFLLLGLGTSTSKEAKEYFSDMKRHRIKFKYGGPQDDHCINMVCNLEMSLYMVIYKQPYN